MPLKDGRNIGVEKTAFMGAVNRYYLTFVLFIWSREFHFYQGKVGDLSGNHVPEINWFSAFFFYPFL